MKYCYSLLTLLLLASLCTAQVAFQRTYGGSDDDYGLNVILTADGGYALINSAESNTPGIFDIGVIKIDKYGATQWSKTYGGNGAEDGYGIQQLSDGGYAILGTTMSYGAGGMDCYLLRTDSVGDTLWTKTIGGSDLDWPLSLEVTDDGDFVFAGFTNEGTGGASQAYLVKVDSDGNLVWTKTYGDADTEYAYGMAGTADNGFVMVGFSKTPLSTSCPNGNCQGILLIKTDLNGDMVWTKTYNSDAHDFGYSVDTVSSGGYIITGSAFDTTTFLQSLTLLRVSEVGDIVWAKTYDGTGSELGYSVKETMDGGFVIAGHSNSGFPGALYYGYLLKTDVNGVEEWSVAHGGTGDDRIYNIKQTEDGGYILSGASTSFSAGDHDIYLIKTDATGYSGGCSEYIPQVTEGSLTLTVTSVVTTGSFGTIQSAGNEGIVVAAADKFLCLVEGTAELGAIDKYTLYPNPSTGTITIDLDGIGSSEMLTIKIHNTIGQLVYTKKIQSQSNKLDLKSMGPGLYYVTLEGNGQAKLTKKLVLLND